MRRSVLLALGLLAAVIAVALHAETEFGGGVWETHRVAGAALWRGDVPSTPGFPIWGYSLLAAPLGAGVVVVQLALLLVVLAVWLGELSRGATGQRGIARFLANPAVLIAVLSPWILLTLSYYSNSLSALLAWIGAWAMLELLRRRAVPAWFLLAGALVGLAANIRAENLLLAALLAGGLFAHAVVEGRWLLGLVRAAALGVGTLVTMVPWLVYTQQTRGAPSFTSTNSGGVMYLGLGVLPGNPWNVQADDVFVDRIAAAEVGTHAFSKPANDLFRARFREAVSSHPTAFARRVIRGWRLALTQGLEMPPLQRLTEFSEEDLRLADFLNERAKARVGLVVNQREVAQCEAEGVTLADLSPRHYAMVAVEYAARGGTAALLLVLLLWSCVVVHGRLACQQCFM